jgi:hypothetical protein
MKYINDTSGTSKVGYAVKISPKNRQAVVYCTASDTQCLGIIVDSVPYREMVEIQNLGVAKVYTQANTSRGAIVRSRIPSDGISNGACKPVALGDAGYIRIGTALETGRGLIDVQLNIEYVSAVIAPDAGIVTVTTTPYTVGATDEFIVVNSATAVVINLPSATGSGREMHINNIGAGTVTVTPVSPQTINGETTQSVHQYECMDIKDYLSTKFLII